MADEKLDLLEKQIETLEKRIFGEADKDSAYPKDSPEVVETLANLKQKMTTTIASRKKIDPVMKRLGELNDYLDPAYTDSLTSSHEAKTEIILAEEAYLQQTAANLEKVKDMADVLGSEHIKVVPGLEDKLHQLSKIHIQQQDSTCELSDETKALLLNYNNAISLLSKQFVAWDDIVTRMEIAKQPQKVVD